MKRFAPLALISLLCVTPAVSDTLSDPEKLYATASIAALMNATYCNLEVIASAWPPYADKNGVDGKKIFDAVWAAVQANSGGKYNRDSLIPEVTRLTVAFVAQSAIEVQNNKAKFCNDWSSMLVERLGLMKRK
jgi:hypothetical protein